MEVVACRTSKINTIFTATVLVAIYGTSVKKQICVPKINTIFTAAVAVLVPKYIYGQYLCEKANAGTAMWKLWRAGLEK